MRIRTRWVMPAAPEVVWPLLYGSRLASSPRCPVFLVGTPQPVECRLPDPASGPGEGAVRECVSDRGVIRQRITVSRPGERLQFAMEETTLRVGRLLAAVEETFDLEALSGGRTLVRRTTQVRPRRGWGSAAAPATWIGLKAVHRYVFADWAAQLRAA